MAEDQWGLVLLCSSRVTQLDYTLWGNQSKNLEFSELIWEFSVTKAVDFLSGLTSILQR